VDRERPENREGTQMRRILLVLALMTVMAVTPTLDESLAPTTAHAATLTSGGALDTGSTVMNSRKKHKKAAKKAAKHNGSNSKHRT
jgi:hypothetical protein